ncbi:MAG: Spo0E family sporulation regulatory protein-aspartic acid phosphatase [Lachnospirales bacterium]|nr:Spo0E family sporulation regulatory protein-aspartic acid phosphatase [Clostridiales bacterium]
MIGNIRRKIEVIRRKLNNQIENNAKKEKILKTSIKLDTLINKYYTYNINIE